MKLSPNFSLRELTRSSTAIRNGINQDPDQETLLNLIALSNGVLQPIRNEFGGVSVNSGFRSPQLNTLIGGSKTSDHCRGCAADIELMDSTVSNLELAQWCEKNLVFKQVILEFWNPEENDPRSGWVHISYDRDGKDNDKSLMTAKRVNGKTEFHKGLNV